MRSKGIWKALPILVLLTIFTIGAMVSLQYYINRNTVVISHDSGIYAEPFSLEIRTIRPSTIYYTTDGSVPSVTNSNVLIYEEPIDITPGEDATVYSFQFKCVFADGEESPVFTREFLLEQEGSSRYQTSYIVSINGEEDALFGYESGVFVRGRQFDEFMAENPDVNQNAVIIPANYYSETEVPVHVSVFTGDGKEVITKNCGLRIYGNVTRAKNQKSFRLYARDIYDGVNEFTYELIPELVSDVTDTIIDEYQRISFHNSGNDNGYAFVRNALIGKLADQFGFDDVLLSESAVVYVNGRYQGFYWLQNTYDDRYFKEKYGDYNGEMVVCEGQLDEVSSTKEDTSVQQTCIEEYNEFCEWITSVDVNDSDNWQRVYDTIDVENFAKYMAIEYYIGNTDWPHNNVKAYRYVASEPEGYEDHSVFDGRYRYLLFDTDYGMGLLFLGWFGNDVYSQRLEQLCKVDDTAGLFGSMMQREEFRNMFVNAVLLLNQRAFSAENVEIVLEELAENKDAELHYMFEETDLLKNSIWESDDNSFESVETEYEEILDFAQKRPDIVRSEMQNVLGCGEILPLSIIYPYEGTLLIDGMEVGNSYEGYCFENIPMTISCELPAGSRAVGYYVNDQYIEGEGLELDVSQWIGRVDKLNIQPNVKTSRQERLSIVAYDIDGRDDYVILENTGNMELLLSEYSVSDSEETSKGRLPGVILQPGERYYVYGKQYTGDIEKNGIKMSFSWNDEEQIILLNQKEGIIEQRK